MPPVGLARLCAAAGRAAAGCAAAWCAAALCGVAGLAAAAEPPPVQVRLEQRDPDSLVGSNRVLQLECLGRQGVAGDAAEARVVPVPPAVLQAFVNRRIERLFDGPRQAEYDTQQALTVSPGAKDCRPLIVRRFSVRQAVGCELEVQGQSAQALPGLPPAPASFTQGKPEGRTPTCPGRQARERKAGYEGLPVLRINGVPCVSTQDAIKRAMGQTPPDTPWAERHGDTCLWAEMPLYAQQAGRQVVVATADLRPPAERAAVLAQARATGTQGQTALLPVSLQQAPIEAARFTPAAAQAFVRQATEVPLTEAHAGLR